MMLVGAASTMFRMRASVTQSLRGAVRSSGQTSAQGPTERDIPARWVILSIAVLFIPVTAIYYGFTGGWTPAIVAAATMGGAGFLLSAVGGYLVGLVGSSNQPLSGLTLSALVLAALLLLAMA